MMGLTADVRYCPSTAAWPGLWWGHYRREDLLLLLLLLLLIGTSLIYLVALSDSKGNRRKLG